MTVMYELSRLSNATQNKLAYLDDHPDAQFDALRFEGPDHSQVARVNAVNMHPDCTLGQWWFNVCIKAFTIIFSYVNFLPIPWRLAIAHHCLGACACASPLHFRPASPPRPAPWQISSTPPRRVHWRAAAPLEAEGAGRPPHGRRRREEELGWPSACM